MKCERCNVEMHNESVSFCLGHRKEKKHSNGGIYQDPVIVKSIYTCPKCGKIELNANESE